MPEPCVHAPLPFESITFLALTHLSLPPGLFDSAVRSDIYLTLVAWMIHRSLGFRSLHPISFSNWALLRCGLSPFYLAHNSLLSCICGLACAPSMPPHCSCYDITYPLTYDITALPMVWCSRPLPCGARWLLTFATGPCVAFYLPPWHRGFLGPFGFHHSWSWHTPRDIASCAHSFRV